MQIIGFVAFPISFLSLVLGTMSWHFHLKETVFETLTLLDRIKVAPFFLCIIVSKVWVMSDFLNTLRLVLQINVDIQSIIHISLMMTIFLLIGIQIFLHKLAKFKFAESWLGSMANLVTLWRPTHDESKNMQ